MEAKRIRSATAGKHGELTVRIADNISDYWEKRDCYVIRDHNSSGRKIVSSFGEETPNRNTQLGHVDILIAQKNLEDKGADKVVALIEIEETTDKPKVLLGDVFGVLMADHISTRNGKLLEVNKHTILIILAKSKVVHKVRNTYLIKKVIAIKPHLTTTNSDIERIFIKALYKEERLIQLLTSVLFRAFKGEL